MITSVHNHFLALLLRVVDPSLPAAASSVAAQTDNADGGLLGLMVPVVVISLGLLAMLWWLRRGKTLRGGQGPLRIVQAVAVGSRERLVVVDAQNRRLLLGVTASRVELIAELQAGQTPEQTERT